MVGPGKSAAEAYSAGEAKPQAYRQALLLCSALRLSGIVGFVGFGHLLGGIGRYGERAGKDLPSGEQNADRDIHALACRNGRCHGGIDASCRT
jgi:hypothetical protein